MAEGVRITDQSLQKAFNELPPDVRDVPMRAAQAVGSAIVRAFFGQDWFDKYVMPEGGRNGALTIDESNDTALISALFRVVDLAEILINLQHAQGFDHVIDRMRSGDIEGAHAELDFGRMLYINGAPFRFVTPSGIKRADYDVEVLYPDDLIACGDAKCKVTRTNFSVNAVRNALMKARKQLPDDRPGIVFVKIPQAWLEDEGCEAALDDLTNKFLRGTKRIVSVKYYVSQVAFIDGFLTHSHRFMEFSNRRTRFGDDKDWTIFNKESPPEWNGMPPFWVKLIDRRSGVPDGQK